MYHSFLIHSSADGHLGCFYVPAMINSAVMNIGVHVSLSDLVSLLCMPRSGIAGSYGSSICSFMLLYFYQSLHISGHVPLVTLILYLFTNKKMKTVLALLLCLIKQVLAYEPAFSHSKHSVTLCLFGFKKVCEVYIWVSSALHFPSFPSGI